ncbi:MAG: hypothetical protein ABW106_14790 [Steroidobacteraceae bacterium]
MKTKLLTSGQGGWAASEYLAVLVGLMAIWRVAHIVLDSLQRSHADFTWALMIPY